MPIQTHVENGCLVGYHPPTGAHVQIPLAEIVEAAGVPLSERERAALNAVQSADSVMAGIEIGFSSDEVGAGKIAKKIKKGLKKTVQKVAKSKLVKGIVNVVKKVTPPPFNVAIVAAEGAAKFAKSLKNKKTAAKAKKALPAIRAAAAGKITPQQLDAAAKKAGVDPKLAADAAVTKRVALQAQTDPKAAAAFRLMQDVTSTEPAAQKRALGAAAAASAGPGTQAYIVQTPSGQTFSTLVQTG